MGGTKKSKISRKQHLTKANQALHLRRNIEGLKDIPLKSKCARRIIGVQSLLQFVEQTNTHAKTCKKYRLVPVQEIQSGLESSIRFQCNCGWIVQVDSNDSGSTLPANGALAWGCQNSSVGYEALTGLFSSLDLPVPSPTTYRRAQTECKDSIMTALEKELASAAEEEKRLAIEAGDFVTVGGQKYPAITVIVDGGWSKRSYGHSYNSNNGVAVIIGARTKKVIYMGTKTKSCPSCKRSVTENRPIKHNCMQNHNESSCKMETNIIFEGCKLSILMYGLVYWKVIGDGDSSVYASIRNVYDGITVEKIECINHVLRNFNTKLFDIAKNTVKGKNAADIPLEERKLVTNEFPRFGIAIRKSVEYYRKNLTDDSWKELQSDLRNIPFHVFGQHDNCKSYFCDKVTVPEENKIPSYTKLKFWEPLQVALARVVNLAKSLIEKQTTNQAESFMSVANKCIEGKRKNFGHSYLYPLKMACAVFSFNNSAFWINKAFSMSTEAETSKYWKERSELAENKRKRKRQAKVPRKVNFPVYKTRGDKDYGSNPTRPDLEDEELASAIENLRSALNVSDIRREEIFKLTTDQAMSDEWFRERKNRITASFAGRIFKLRPTTDNTATINEILGRNKYVSIKTAAALEYGKENEETAIRAYEVFKGLEVGSVRPCGLYVSKESGIFGASPDGLIDEEGIIEVKCPHSLQDKSPKDWPDKSKSASSLEFKDGNLRLKKNSNHYYQVIMQLYVAEKNWCDYIVWTPEDIFVERIQKSKETEKLWNLMKIKLEKFWMEDLAPEIVDSRFERGFKDYRCSKLRDEARTRAAFAKLNVGSDSEGSSKMGSSKKRLKRLKK